MSCCFSLSALAQNTWTGAVSGNWATTGNWSLSAVPTATNNVVIPSGTLNSPTITASTTAVARSVEVQSGAQLTIGNSATLTISISKVVSGSATSFYNAGTVNNNGLILVGSQVNTARDYGISNPGTFNNNSGARIQIDRSTDAGLYNPASGTFTNSATITIGASTTVGQYGIQNAGTCNNVAGRIIIDRSADIGLLNAVNGTFINSATITIGASATVGRHGINNRSTFTNNTGATIQIDRSSEIGLYNLTAGRFANSATITIGASTTVGDYGLRSDGVFSNLGGQLRIDRAINTGLFSTSTASFTNAAVITIGASTTIGLYGFWSNGTFSNNVGGLINVDNSTDYGFVNGVNGTFTNAADIVVGASGAVGTYGFENKGNFANNAGGRIQIDRSTSNGLITDPGSTFINSATITIGASATVGTYGLLNIGSFTNSTNGQIQIDRSLNSGLFNPGSFTNVAFIRIGALAPVGDYGVQNIAGFTNAGGQLNIDRSTTIGLLNTESGSFINSATITIGALAAVGPSGVLNYTAATFNNAGCSALLNIVADAVISNANSFSNTGTIIENATGNSTISYNAGLLLNRNGGSFLVTSGAQPLSLSTAPPTNCSPPLNGSLTISGLQANTTYTLSYTTAGIPTTVAPNPVSNANGELTITGLGAGTYTLSLSGSCVALPLPLSATIDGALTPTLSLGTLPTICTGATSLILPYTATTGSPDAYSLLGAGVIPVSGGRLASAPASITVGLSSPATAPSLNFTLLVSNTATGCASANGIPVSISVNTLTIPPAAIESLTANESACPMRLLGQATGTAFIFTGPGDGSPGDASPNSYVFSNVYRTGGTYDVFADGVLKAGVYTLTATYTNSCGASTPVSQTVTVNRNCP